MAFNNQLPGSSYPRNGRWYWRVRLPGKSDYETYPLRPLGHQHATTDYGIAFECAKMILRKHTAPITQSAVCRTVNDLCGLYLDYADGYYRHADGTPTKEPTTIRLSLRPLQDDFGMMLAEDFGPAALKQLRQNMIDSKKLCRREINRRINIIKRMYRWATSESLLSPSAYAGLQAVAGLKQNRTTAIDHSPRQPVDDKVVFATLPHTTQVIADMILIQRYTGMRPEELCIMRPCDVDRVGEIWIYKPKTHKTQYRGKDRRVYIGPRAQKILGTYLENRVPAMFCFVPTESETQRHIQQRKKRKSKVYGKQKLRQDQRVLSDRYDVDSYRKAVKHAIKKAGVDDWTPYQLRHSIATQIRDQADIEASAAILGNDPDVAKIYAKRLDRIGIETAKKFG